MNGSMHYLPPDPDSGRFGLHLTACGAARIAPGAAYPAPGHPGSHLLSWLRGRVLGEYQLVHLVAGGGEFEDRSGLRRVRAGESFLLVPGRWHRYRPDPATGWSERWIACIGPAVGRLFDDGRLRPDSLQWPRRLPADALSHLAGIITLCDRRPHGWRSSAEGLAAAMLARIDDDGTVPGEAPLHAAAQRMRHDPTLPVAALAGAAGLSPSQFRLRFAAVYGRSPRRYRQAILAEQARRLLSLPGVTVADVAEALGFSDPSHFTRAFRRAGGGLPSRLLRRPDDPLDAG